MATADPDRLARLKDARERLILGESEAEIERTEANGVTDRVKFVKADLPRLERLIAELERAASPRRPAGIIRPYMSKGV